MMTEKFASQFPISIDGLLVHVTGARGVGKTMFTITCGASPNKIAFFDGEASAKTYNAQLPYGVYRNLIVDVSDIYGNQCSDEQYFLTVSSWLEELGDNAHDVLVFDNILRFENGLVSYVNNNFDKFGISRGQMAKMPSLIWGPIKSLYESIVVSWLKKASIVFITTPIKETWVHSKPSGIFKPQGKDVLEALTGLRIWLRFRHGSKYPIGLVLKDRISKLTLDSNGGIQAQSVLPRRIDPCTWQTIKEYMANPADAANPAPQEVLTDDEWCILNGILSKDKLLQLEVAKMELENDRKAETLAVSTGKRSYNMPTARKSADAVPSNVAELVARAFSELSCTMEQIIETAGVPLGEIDPDSIDDIWTKLQDKDMLTAGDDKMATLGEGGDGD